MTLKLTSAQVVETSVIVNNNSSFQAPVVQTVNSDIQPLDSDFFFFNSIFYFYFILNIQVSHHLQIAKLIKAGGVWTA